MTFYNIWKKEINQNSVGILFMGMGMMLNSRSIEIICCCTRYEFNFMAKNGKEEDDIGLK